MKIILQADRQRAFRETDAIANPAQIVGIFCVALLVAGVVKVQEKTFVRQISLQHPGTRMCHADRQRELFIHLEDDDVLQLVALLFPNVNFAPRKLVDHLVAPEERDRVLRREIEDAATQFFLRSRGDIYVQP